MGNWTNCAEISYGGLKVTHHNSVAQAMGRYELVTTSNMTLSTSFFDLRMIHYIVGNIHVLCVRIRVLYYTF